MSLALSTATLAAHVFEALAFARLSPAPSAGRPCRAQPTEQFVTVSRADGPRDLRTRLEANPRALFGPAKATIEIAANQRITTLPSWPNALVSMVRDDILQSKKPAAGQSSE